MKVRVAGAMGSGTLIAVDGERGLILTAEHVVRGQTSATAEFLSGYRASGAIVFADRRQDSAAFVIKPPPDAVIIPLAQAMPSRGAEIEIVGYPQGGRLRSSRARLNGYDPPDHFMNISFPRTIPGESGGPFVWQGTVVGTVTGITSTHNLGPNAQAIGTRLRDVFPIFRRPVPEAAPPTPAPQPQPIIVQPAPQQTPPDLSPVPDLRPLEGRIAALEQEQRSILGKLAESEAARQIAADLKKRFEERFAEIDDEQKSVIDKARDAAKGAAADVLSERLAEVKGDLERDRQAWGFAELGVLGALGGVGANLLLTYFGLGGLKKKAAQLAVRQVMRRIKARRGSGEAHAQNTFR